MQNYSIPRPSIMPQPRWINYSCCGYGGCGSPNDTYRRVYNGCGSYSYVRISGCGGGGC